jgi:hypothetical protein
MRFPRVRLARKARYLLLLALVAVCLFAATGSASATSASAQSILDPCGQTVTRPFLPWLDPLGYAFAPNGGLEGGLTGWTSTGAGVVAGNESYFVHAAVDSASLSLPPGSSATTPPICIATLSPVARLFARNTGSPLATVRVDVLYTTLLGIRGSALVGVLVGSSSWQPTLPLPVLANVIGLPLLSGGSTQIALRFTAQGAGGSWQLDDLYVDPYKGT